LTRIGLIHDYTGGIRLSELLVRAETARQSIHLEASLFVIKDILTSLCELHRQSGDLAHGALAPERIVLADGRIRIADYVLGSAIEQLRFTTERYWKELRVAVPPTAGGARFDRHVDVAQVGMIATALFVGRRLGDSEHLGVVGDLLKRTQLPQPILSWLLRALHLDPRRVFMQANDALQAFGEAIAEAGVRADARALDVQGARPRTVPLPPRGARGPSPPKPPGGYSPPPQASLPAPPPPLPKVAIQPKIQVAPLPVAPPKPKQDAWQGYDVDPYASTSQRTIFSRGGMSMPPDVMRYAWGVGMAIVLALVFAASQYVSVPEWLYATTGTLVVESNPPGIQVFVNGTSHGVTPLTLKVESGRHEVELRGSDRPRIFHITVARGQRVAQYVEFPPGRRR
jgi:hypothetical protein